MSRAALIGLVVVTAVVLAAWRSNDIHSAGLPSGGEDVLVGLGDVVRVKDSVVGCRVTRRREFPGQTILDCRRAGPLPGTFGAFLGDRKVLVVRFGERRAAKVVFTGTHTGRSTKCG
jgi:hypothetical protein